MNKKVKLLICFAVLLIGTAFFFLMTKSPTGSVVEEENKTDYSFEPMNPPGDKDCFELRNGKIACLIARAVKIEPGEVAEIDSAFNNTD